MAFSGHDDFCIGQTQAASWNLAGLDITFLAGTLGQGGAERQLYYILKTLRGCGLRPSLLTLSGPEFWEARIAELGVSIERIEPTSSRMARLIRIVFALRRHKPTICQSQHFYTNAYAAFAARLVGCHEIGAMRNNG